MTDRTAIDSRTPNSSQILGVEIRITAGGDSIISCEGGRFYHDGKILGVFPEHVLRGKRYEKTLALLDFGRQLPLESSVCRPTRYVLARSVGRAPLDAIMDGYWLDVNLFGVEEDLAGMLTSPLDLDSAEIACGLGEEMLYRRPKGKDPYSEAWVWHSLVASRPIGSQPYRNRELNSCFEVVIETTDGRKLTGITIQDNLAKRPLGSMVRLNYHLSQCDLVTHISEPDEGFLTKTNDDNPYSYEFAGRVCAMWWPERGVLTTDSDMAGRWFSIESSSGTIVLLEDSLDARNAIGRIRMGDGLRVRGRLEVTLPPEDVI